MHDLQYSSHFFMNTLTSHITCILYNQKITRKPNKFYYDFSTHKSVTTEEKKRMTTFFVFHFDSVFVI